MWSQDTFVEKAGGSEILQQMWTFTDKSGRPCCLIPEATALFQEQAVNLLGGARERMLFYIARCYRYERPQAGRYREFTQLGFEYLCAEPERAAAFSVDVATGFLDSLGVRYDLDRAARRGLSYYLGGQGFEMRCARRPAADRGRWRVSRRRGFRHRSRTPGARDVVIVFGRVKRAG
ncbi:ATP phosphoribosyltransferase regulatory subunit [Paraburkholderia tropica]|uniref:ATP phosphoribosyltransferase regulatory subunit n=1 Tax=Paraburkholderia tropica TaxID=92647 RepID=UPI001F3269C8|nr:ATP phosphoribosyltransferase regulatory subunit [Paraburkholderia tropica]